MTAQNPGAAAPSFTILALRVYLPFAAAYFLSYLYRTVNAVVGPVIADELHLSAGNLGLISSAYFIMFAGIQLPLGVALDRFGPRRVQGTLLVAAAAGAAMFAMADSVAGLVIGRTLIGMGVAAGLMGALKIFTLWFPPERWPLMTGLHMAAGGLGSLVATGPTQAALSITTWHGLFFWLAGATLAVAVVIWTVVPEKPGSQAPGSLADQFRDVGRILRDGYFWRLVPVFTAQQCAYIGIQTLWIGPWLRDVGGEGEAMRAVSMTWTAGAMALGFLSSGFVAGALSRRGIGNFATATGGIALFIVAHAIVTFCPPSNPLWIWIPFGFLGTFVIVYFPVLTQAFPLELSGRVTTSVNAFMFASIFVAQWLMGVILDMWPRTASGGYDPRGYTYAFGLFVVLEVVSLAWLLVSRARPWTERERRPAA
ncbi:MAG: MFS transporter [Rhodospirillales bacterium]|nr:MAG: MFS transporter [Rhodospirillales bacterium]